ncbi:hypothetical protein ACFL9U_15380 [Thermodesulfobacteriota bacterium]
MPEKSHRYKAIFSSDWNECLAPCGPFDCISFAYPQLAPGLETIFKQYTGNRISLGQAASHIRKLLPGPITTEQMDAYLDKYFSTYQGVPELIEWCRGNDILFMINTTGLLGYFQRIFAKGLLPIVPVLSAHPMIRYPGQDTDPPHVYELLEIEDKGSNSAAMMRTLKVPPAKIILMGDSGGDGPHFRWGADTGAFLIGSMTKPSLQEYCQSRSILIDCRFGLTYAQGEKRDPEKERQIDFMALTSSVAEFLGC